MPVFLSLICFAVFKRVYSALIIGACCAALLINHFSLGSSFSYLMIDVICPVIFNADHFAIIVFTLMIGALTGLLRKSGAIYAFIHMLSNLIIGPRSLQVVTALCGLIIFFDDHANCHCVGSSMRKSFQTHGVSKEKLAFIVDSTAAPVACLALVSTWIAFQVGLIDDALKNSTIDLDAYALFIDSIPYNFYALFTLVIVFITASTGRDFGPMLLKETISAPQKKSAMIADKTENKKLALFLVPTIALIGMTFLVLLASTKTNSYMAMLIGASFSLFTALLIVLATNIAEPHEAFSWIMEGIKNLLPSMALLMFAWFFARGLADLSTASYLANLISKSFEPALLPTLVFALSALLSFITGTSFGTMAWLMPTALPIIFLITNDSSLYCATVAALLGGSVFGDHCSPISDTTILSSISAQCDLNAHSSTQMPYALLGAFLSIFCGTIPIAFGISHGYVLTAGIVIIYFFFRIAGQENDYSFVVVNQSLEKKLSI